jgi:DNA topoisomerase-2
MAIWSLTTERVDKLRKQIGDKEEEVDMLIKLSPKDIWNVDLDAFVSEWNTQIDEDAKRKKKIAGMTRRASKKLGIEGGKGKKKKRKASGSDSDDDSASDFGPAKKKVKPKKEGGLLSYLRQDEPVKKPNATAALKSSSAFGSTAPPKQGTLLTHLVKKEGTPQVDGTSDDNPEGVVDASAPAPAPAPATKRGRPAVAKTVTKKAPVIESDDDDSDVFAAVAKEIEKSKPAGATTSRTGRAATKQAPKYNIDDSDSDSDGDDLLGDVSTMVKTIGAAGSNGVPLFKSTATARPGSNGGARPASAAGGSKVAKKNSLIEIDDDTTNYEGLMPQPSPKRPAPRNVNDTIMSSDDDDESLSVRKPAPSKLTAKPKLTATKAAPKPKTTSTLVAKPTTALSPAAKAYAAKLAKTSGALSKPAPKAKKPVAIDSDDEMEDADAIANDILSDEEDEDEPTPKPAKRAPAARPGRRAAAAKPAKYVVSDEEDESDEASEPSFDDDDESE